VKRSRSSGTPLDIGFDLKGAATDALKKCASLIGVALYLWKKEPPAGLGTAASRRTVVIRSVKRRERLACRQRQQRYARRWW